MSLQANHKFQVNVQRRIYGHATNVDIKPLNEEKAVQAASDFVGEFLIFAVMRLVQPAFSSKDRVLHNFSLIGFEHIVTLNHCYVLPISRAFSFPFSPLQAD